MSLIVYAYKRDSATGKILDLDVEPTPPHNNLAGFESWRQMVYGSPVARKLGLTLLLSLGENLDIYAEGADLERLKSEAEILLANAASIVPGGKDHRGQPIIGAIIGGLAVGKVDSDFVRRHGGRVAAVDHEAAIKFRVENILEAIRLAKEVSDGSGGVYIG